jgi:hypothetical protein
MPRRPFSLEQPHHRHSGFRNALAEPSERAR